MNSKVRRIGRYWIGTDLLEEGYRPEDIFDIDSPTIELPQLINASKRRSARWLHCPRCHEITQIALARPSCEVCGWNQRRE